MYGVLEAIPHEAERQIPRDLLVVRIQHLPVRLEGLQVLDRPIALKVQEAAAPVVATATHLQRGSEMPHVVGRGETERTPASPSGELLGRRCLDDSVKVGCRRGTPQVADNSLD